MHLFGTHRSALARLRLARRADLGAGNFFWHTCAVATDLDRPLLYRRESTGLTGHSLAELRDRVLRYANWYRANGVRPGTRVGVHTVDGLAGLLHHVAITSLGGATVLTNPNMAAATARDYFQRAETELLVADARLIAATYPDGGGPRPHSLSTVEQEAVDTGQAPGHPYANRDDDVILVSHSSGTTGIPKPATFAHRSFAAGKKERLWNFPSARSDRMLTALPQSHSSGISYLSLAIMLGLPTLLVDDQSGAAVAEAMNAFEPTVVLGFPITLADLPIGALTERARSGVHTWMGMGDASHERHIRPLVRIGRTRARGGWTTGSTYVDGLGSSEMGMVLFKVPHTADSDNYGRLIGRPVAVVESAAALDPTGREVPTGAAGLLGVRTPSATPGYDNDPELTERATLNGYFLTGDVVSQDAEGNFYHLDRTPDVITTAAGAVHSLPVEEVVLTETGAFDAAVVAADDPAGQASLPVAVVLFNDGTPVDPDELLRRCNTALERAGLAPLAALVVAADRAGLPVGVTGKVLKRVLRETHRDLLRGKPPADVAHSRTRSPEDEPGGVTAWRH
ncbi:class I adenylate-forming enzyme family protein [Actinokineospora globicatena]|uniref:class I adenylate-forming enzyme family protein n=1 Tax=Actinokineospora globicatena TaxID=103729 RepID=UPI0020A32ED5|nr:class I adenylate-forming enzyme family protein [Actinokineospora globicatena]MCP2306759.1 Acyl-CoA synthetase (AMP-forming)/AMP-acid ligase II [Actinokineospora globicatena]GLW82122.1 hypothetical protein Aglo01_66030 [Actinokineospora globicatena]GLW88915.1 hypothetical protein Aglo02_65540 [Actinokineospora globicatena]